MTTKPLSIPGTCARALALLGAAVLAHPAAAHPGHGDPSHAGTPAHWLGEPVHAVALAAAVLAAVGLLEWRRARRTARSR
ncbi:MAG: hypothetical protein R3E88_05850 [Myxococcota bacterium]|nr:hypothetical protein [Myxococcales bacterium]